MATNKQAKKAKPTPEEVIKEELQEEEKKGKKSDVIGGLKGGKKVHQKGFLKIKAVRGPIDKRNLPEDIRKWLTNKGYGTNIYLRSKEELERRHVDLDMVEKLKEFISKNYL